MAIAAEHGGEVSGRADLLKGLRDVRSHIERGNLAGATLDARLLQHDPALAIHPDLASELLGNLGTLLLIEAMGGAKDADRLLGEAIDLLNRARTMAPGNSATFDLNLVLAHCQRFRNGGSAGDLLLANLILDGIDGHALDPWARDIRKLVAGYARRTS